MLNSPALYDAFGRLRVSNPQTLFDTKQVFDNGVPLLMVEDTTGAGASITWDQPNARSVLTSGTAGTGRATRQSRRYLNYQPGKSQLSYLTFNLRGAEAFSEKRVGMFDDTDGLYLALPASGVPNLVRRSSSSVPTEVVAQPDWNLDPMNGNGPSGITLNLSMSQILAMDFEWLGVGSVRMGFVIDGEVIYAHEFLNANVAGGVYMQTPNLPLRWEIVNTAGAASPTMDAICGTVISEGGQQSVGLQRGAALATVRAIGAGATVPLLSIRLKAAYNRASVFPRNVFAAGTSANAAGTLLLILNGTLGGGTAWTPQSNSAVEVDIASTTVAGGVILATSSVGRNGIAEVPPQPAVALASDFAGVPDTLTVAVTSVANDSWIGSINWQELQ